MSLVICSNQTSDAISETQSSIYKPWSFRNALSSTYKVPKNAQVALQSCKYNLDGTIDLSNDGQVYYQFTGETILDGANVSTTTASPIRTEIYADNGIEEVTIEQMAERIKESMNKRVFHPMFRDLCDCNVKRDITTSEFKGYDMIYNCSDTLTPVVPADSKAIDGLYAEYRIDPPLWTYLSGDFSTTSFLDGVIQSVLLLDKPQSTYNASMQFDITGIDTTANPWGVGASRYVDLPDSAAAHMTPEYFETDTLWDPGDFNEEQNFMCDFFVYQDPATGELRLAHAVADSSEPENVGKIMMREIDYTQNSNSHFNEKYDMATNTTAYTSVSIEFQNQKVSVYLHKTGAKHPVIEYLAGEANKDYNFKPINQSCWDLFPFMWLSTVEGSFTNTITFLGMDTCDWIIDYEPNAQYSQSQRGSWYNLLEHEGITEDSRELEIRPWNDYAVSPAIAQKGVVSSPNAFLDISNILIVFPSDVYSPSYGANAQDVLGYENEEIVIFPDASPNFQKLSSSNSVPTLLSSKTMFLRLENFTQQSVNAFQGNRSSIISHLPRFDGQVQTGRIYHEPKNLIFLDLLNTEELNLNSFDISFCYSNEQFVQALTGQSVVVLYFREKPKERVDTLN